MKLYLVTKQRLCLGTGDPNPEWVKIVRAPSQAVIEKIVSRFDCEFISIKEVTGISPVALRQFMRQQEEGSPDDEVWHGRGP